MTDLEFPPAAPVANDRLPAPFAEAEARHAELLKEKTEAERALTLVQTEKEALARKLKDLDAELGETLVAAAQSAAKHRAALAEMTQRAAHLERDVAARTAREGGQPRDGESPKTTMSARIAGLEAEKSALVQRLSVVESGRDSALSEAAQREETQRVRASRLEVEAAAHLEREAHLREELTLAQRTSASAEQQAGQALTLVQAEKEALARKLEGLEARLRDREASKTNLSGRIAALAAEKEALVQKLSAVETREAAWLRDREASKTTLSGRIAGLVVEKEALTQKLSVVESDRDSALSEAARREETQRHAIAEQRARAERLEAEAAAHKEFEARLTEDGARLRTGLLAQISRLEAEAALAQKTFAELLAQRAEGERALAQARGEAKEASEALAEAAKREDVERQVLDAERQRAEQLEKDIDEGARLRAGLVEKISRLEAEVVRALSLASGEAKEASEALADTERGHAQAMAEALRTHEALRVSLAEQIARTEAAAAAAEGTRTERVAQQAEGEKALESIRAESEALFTKVAGMEADHSMAMAEALRREDALRQALDAERQRAEQLEKDIEAFFESEARLIREWEASRAEWSERIRVLEEAAAESGAAHTNLLARKKEADEALAALQADRDTLVMRLSEIEWEREQNQNQVPAQTAVENEGAVGGRESTPAEAWEAARTELLARIARLEANEVIADKARSELLVRKRDSDRALAAAQTERTALLNRLAIAERAPDQN